MNIKTGIFIALAALCSVSCITTRKVAYLQDMEHNSQIQLENQFEAVISPYDELDILISSFDPELAKPFNLSFSGTTQNIEARQNMNYLVSQEGNIELPVLGPIHAAGMTRLQLQDQIKKMLIDGGYISDPYVMVRFRSFKIFFLGSNGGKAITIPNERCTFLEALAMSGDLNVYTNRKKIAVMREVDGRMVMRYLDPRDSKIFMDPYFMLQQNDFIITRDIKYRNFMYSFTQWQPIFSLFSTGVAAVSAYFAYKSWQNE